MLYTHDIEHCFSPHPGAQGLARIRMEVHLPQLAPACKALVGRQNAAAAPLIDLPFRTDDLAVIEEVAVRIRARFRHVVVAGTGGSGISGRTLTQLVSAFHLPFFYYLENVDPDPMDDLLDRLDMEHTCFLVISKSGSTVETLSQFYVLVEHVAAALGREAVRERFTVITMPGASPLRRSAEEYGLHVLDHPPDIGGRFAVLSVVGLLPAAIAGLDIAALRRGAQTVVRQMETASGSAEFPPAVGAALQYAFIQNHYPITVMLPYAERLTAFSAWYRQGWAESLGKQGKGSTPIPAVGITDQHSQLQLYLDGPKDKSFTLITLNRAGSGRRIPVPPMAELDYLRGKTIGDVMAAEQKATLETLVRNGCPVRVFMLDALKEETLGALLMHFMLEIIFAAALLGVDPFDQPAVEEGKKLARHYLLTGTL